MSGIGITNGMLSFTITADPGTRYRLNFKDELTDSGWTLGDWSTNSGASPVSMTLTDPTAVGQPARYYRLEAAIP